MSTTSSMSPSAAQSEHAHRPWFGWFISDCIAVAKRQVITVLRIPQTLFFALFQPVLFVLLFSFVFGGAIPLPNGGNYREYLLPGIFAQTVTFAVAAATVGVAEDTSKGIMDRFRTLPVNQAAVMVGRSFAEMVERMLVITVMSMAGLLVGWRTHASFASVLSAYAMYLLFAYALTWMGIYVGLSVPSVQVAQTAGVAWVFPLTFLSNAFVPTQGMPVLLQHFAAWNPISCLALGGRTLFGNPVGVPGSEFPQQHPVLMAFLWSSAIIAVFATLAVRKFRSKRG